MPNKTDETAAYWTREIRAALQFRRKYADDARWDTWRRLRRGDHKPNQYKVPVNVIHALIDSFLSETLWGRIKVHHVPLSPSKPFSWERAKVLEAVDNRIIDELNFKRNMEMAALCACSYGTGPIKIGFGSEFGVSALPTNIGGPDDVDPETADVSRDRARNRLEYRDNIKAYQPWIQWWSPRDFLVSDGTLESSDARWCAFRIERPAKDLIKDKRYKNTKNLVGDGSEPVSTMGGTRFERDQHIYQDSNEPVRKVVFWEIHDKKTGDILAVAPRFNALLRKEHNVLYRSHGLPMESLIFTPDDAAFWGISDIKMVEPQLYELNDIRTQAKKARALSVLKFLYRQGAFSETELNKLLSQRAGVGVKVNSGAQGDLKNQVMPLQPNEPMTLLADAEQVFRDIQVILGYSENTLGGFAGGRATATEVQQVGRSHQTRIVRRQERLKYVVGNILRKVNELVFDLWTEDQIIAVTTEPERQLWVQFKGDDLRGEYRTEINIEFSDPVTLATQRREALELLQVAAQTIGPKHPEMIAQLVQSVMQTYKQTQVPEMGPPRNSQPMPFDQYAGQQARGMGPGAPSLAAGT